MELLWSYCGPRLGGFGAEKGGLAARKWVGLASLGMKISPASFYGGGWFGFEGLCATLLARFVVIFLVLYLSLHFRLICFHVFRFASAF